MKSNRRKLQNLCFLFESGGSYDPDTSLGRSVTGGQGSEAAASVLKRGLGSELGPFVSYVQPDADRRTETRLEHPSRSSR